MLLDSKSLGYTDTIRDLLEYNKILQCIPYNQTPHLLQDQLDLLLPVHGAVGLHLR